MSMQNFAGAEWIWPIRQDFTSNQHVQFRKDFRLAGVPKRAPFFITADQCYALYVNGQYVCRGPARGYQKSWPYDEIDLAPWLRRGNNWMSVRCYNAGISTFQYIHERGASLICRATWGKTEIKTDASWLCRIAPGHHPHTGRLSLQLNFQENVDARLEDQRWITSATPVRAADGWKKPGQVFPLGIMPWHDMESRGIPHLTSTPRPYAKTSSIATGTCVSDYRTFENLTFGFWPEFEKLKWRAYTAGRRGKDFFELVIPPTAKGKLTAITLDMGEPTIGALIVDAQGAAGGEVLDFFHTEALNDGLKPYLGPPEDDCHAALTARLTLRPGRTQHEFFQMLGHQHVVIIARENPKPIKLKIALRETFYPLQIRGEFRSSDPVINDIYRISVRTQRVCMLDSYVDTSWREQAQWWGDARVQAQNTFHISGDTRLLVRGIRSIARQEVPNGLTYGHAPTIAHYCILPDFSLIWTITIWDYFHQTGDASLFAEQWPRIERLLGYFTGEGRGKNGLLRFDPRYWLFLDWTEIQKDGTSTLLNLWYFHALDCMTELADAAHMPAVKARLTSLARVQKKLILKHLYDSKARLFRDGITPSGKPVNIHSVHNQTLAIVCNLLPATHQHMLDSVLLPYIRGEKVPGGQPSSYWITYVYDVLESAGHGREVAAHIREHWAPMIAWGGTAESWGKNGRASTNTHAWSAHPIYHFTRTLAGVTQTGTAWETVRFAPVLDFPSVDHAAATIPTPHGLIHASWQRTTTGGIDVGLSLPKGITASIDLPGIRKQTTTGMRRWQIRDRSS